MAFGYAPEVEEEDVPGAPLPMDADAIPPANVIKVDEPVPISAAPDPSQGLPPAVPGSGPPMGAAGAGAPAPESSFPQAAGALPPSPTPTFQPPPAPPQPTGDPAKDIAANQEYGRALSQWHAAAVQQLGGAQNDVRQLQAKRELEIAQEAEKRRQAEEQARAQELAEKRQAISQATAARARAIGDLESGKYKEQSTGAKLQSTIALALGTLGAGFSAAAGHPTGNLAAQTIDNLMQREYDHAKQRVDNANAAIQEARYGYKDAEDNHRAALNDIDGDMAAKYRLVAKEAEQQLLARGASPEQVQQNELVYGSLVKASQYEDQIHAREIEAQRKAEAAEQKKALDASTIRRNNAQADSAEALAGYRNRRGTGTGTGKGGAGGLSKAEAKAQKDELKDLETAAKPYINSQIGSAKSPGSLKAYESAVAVSNELREAAKSGDPNAMKIAVLHAQEQSTRFLTNAAPTQQTFAIQHELASPIEQLEAKFGGWTGQPTEARSYVIRMAQNIDAIAKQRKEVMDATVGEAATRLQSIAKSDEGKRRMQGILDSLGGKRAGEAAPERKTIGGGVVYERQADGKWHRVKDGDIKL